MGFLDRFRAAPAPRVDKPRGESGRGHTDGFLNYDERNMRLVGAPGLETYDKMWRTDPDIRKNLWMIYAPSIGATWDVKPYGGDEASDAAREDAELVKWSLFEQMRPRLPSHVAIVWRILGRAGFVPFEQCWTSSTWKGQTVLVPATLDPRMPSTIDRWVQKNGQLVSIEQILTVTDGDSRVTLPIHDLVYYRLGAEGDNWEGEPLIRPAYKPWKQKEVLELIQVSSLERFAMGIPIGYPSQNASSEQRNTMRDALKNIRANEEGFIVAPGPKAGEGAEEGQGWLYDILTPDSGEHLSILSEALKYERDEISAALLAEFMRLGQEGVGARATADVQQDPFLSFCEALNGITIEDPINEQLVPRIVLLNRGEPADGGFPEVKASLIDSTPIDALASAVQGLVSSNLLTVDDDLEDWLRKRFDMPPADPEARELKKAQMAEMHEAEVESKKHPIVDPAAPGGDKPPGGGGGKAKPPAGRERRAGREPRRLSAPREPRPFEAMMLVGEMREILDAARDAVESAALGHVHDLAVAMRSHPDGEGPPDAPEELVDALEAEFEAIAAVGRRAVAHEIEIQRSGEISGPLRTLAEDPQGRKLRGLAELVASAVVSAIWHAVQRATLAGGSESKVQGDGERAGRVTVRAEAQQTASTALNIGREEEADANGELIKGVIYTSLLDGNRCEQCAIADDGVTRALDDPLRLARKPPNRDCAGGQRCRCMEFYVLKDEHAPALLRLLESGGLQPAFAVDEAIELSDTSSGVMVALYPTSEAAEQLALDGDDALDPEELHITLAYLGKTDALPDPTELHQAVATWAASAPSQPALVSGLGVFTANDEVVTYASIDAPRLPAAREELVRHLEAAGLSPSSDHGFTPHMTLAYGDRREHTPAAKRLRFNRVCVVHGEDRTEYPLGG